MNTEDGQVIWLNSGDVLPPVDCPLVVELTGLHALVGATRTGFLKKKTDAMGYRLFSGQVIYGRFRWTYP